jgi:signal transduction histidine kinase
MREGFSHSLIESQDLERRRIAREVHDSTMQSLAGLGLSIGQLKRSRRFGAVDEIIEEMEQLLGEAQSELRAISFLAHPPQLSDVGIRTALRQLAEGFGRRTGLRITVGGDEAPLNLSPGAEVAIYRLVQEALSNIHRHAHATDAAVSLIQRAASLHVVVADNGKGMPVDILRGVGLSSMKERIREVGGRLTFRRGSPGTTLIATVPVHSDLRAVGDMALPAGPALSHPDRLGDAFAKKWPTDSRWHSRGAA